MIRTAFLLALTAVIGAVEISGAFARATAPGQGAAAVFMTVKNPRDQLVEITGASSSRAGRVELHRTETGADGVKRMVHQPSITIPAKGQVVLAPGGLHVMLLDLTAPLTEGSTINVDVTLGDGTNVTTPVIVKWAGATEATAEKPSCCP